ncbi:MAG: peptide-methionine (R)-S-oxide reductase MsrB [Proteobacteria bacterium]|nr:peptide-methionine (R)-S-oxide reductase MsrB [Pseudomonadota bacterium]
MNISARKSTILGIFATFVLFSQPGLAAEMMNKGEVNNSMNDSQKAMTQQPTMPSEEMNMEEPVIGKREFTVPSDDQLRERLTPLQYKVTREGATEEPFNNAYWDNHEPGLYVDIISGVPLFSSTDKFESGTGWPSFTRPVDPEAIAIHKDRSFLFIVRDEVRGKLSDAHLGHVFDDGPPPTGLRYCMNSAALRFIPAADLEKEGYGNYISLFK